MVSEVKGWRIYGVRPDGGRFRAEAGVRTLAGVLAELTASGVGEFRLVPRFRPEVPPCVESNS